MMICHGGKGQRVVFGWWVLIVEKVWLGCYEGGRFELGC